MDSDIGKDKHVYLMKMTVRYNDLEPNLPDARLGLNSTAAILKCGKTDDFKTDNCFSRVDAQLQSCSLGLVFKMFKRIGFF